MIDAVEGKGGGGVCGGCGLWPEMVFGIWVPHSPGACPGLCGACLGEDRIHTCHKSERELSGRLDVL